jgi:translation initiation factor 3 subunit C
MDKLQSQLHKAFQNLDQAKIEYLHRIRDECLLLKQCDVIMQYFIENNEEQKAAKIAIIKLEHIYYKNDSVYNKTKEALKNQPKKLEALYFLSKPSSEEISNLVKLVVTNLGNKSKVQATLLQCFHHAIHNRYFDAKNLLMNTHISESIHKQPIQL